MTAYHFAVTLQGNEFLFAQLQNDQDPSMLTFSSVGEAIREYSNPNLKEKPESLMNLKNLCEIPGNDYAFTRLLKEVSAPYQHQFKKEDQFLDINIAISCDVLIKEVQVICIQNYYVLSGQSQFPKSVLIEAGSAADRLTPIGKFPCKYTTNKYTTNQNPAQFKFKISQLARYVRLRIERPDKADAIVVSSVTLRGHTMWSFKSSTISSDSESPKVPPVVTFDMLSRCLRYDSVQDHAAKQPSTVSIALSLLDDPQIQSNPAVPDILLSLARHNARLCDSLLDKILSVEAHTSIPVSFLGRLCALEIKDVPFGQHLEKLRKFVFDRLASESARIATSVSSNLVPFISALSYAIDKQLFTHRLPIPITGEQILELFLLAVNSLDGSMMEEQFLRLLSSFLQSSSQNFSILLEHSVTATEREFQEKFDNAQRTLRILLILATCTNATANALLKSPLLKLVHSKLAQLTPSAASGSPQDIQGVTLLLSLLSIVAHANAIKTWLGENVYSTLFQLCTVADYKSAVFFGALNVFRVSANLHPVNQEKIAEHFYDHVKEISTAVTVNIEDQQPLVPQLVLQVMADMFSFQDKIAIAFHSFKGDRSEKITEGALGGKRSEPIRIDPSFCHPNIEVDEAKISAIAGGGGSNWQAVLSTKAITSGVHKWEVSIDHTQTLGPNCYIMIGVCEQHQQLTIYPGNDPSAVGWSYYGASPGYTYHNSQNKVYGEPFGHGDIITVILNMDEETISFAKNGIDLGVAYNAGFSGKTLYPAICLYNPGDKVSFRECSDSPASSISDSKNAASIGHLAAADPASPLKFHRSCDLLVSSANTTIARLEEAVVHSDEYRVRFFAMSQERPLDPQTSISALNLSNLDDPTASSEIVDIKYEMEVKTPEENKDKPQQPVTASVSNAFQFFAKKGGLTRLVNALRLSAETQQRGDDVIRRKWLFELSVYLSIPGYAEEFIAHPECCSILFKVMRDSKDVEESSTNAFAPIRNTLFKIFKSFEDPNRRDQNALVRKEALQNGVIQLLLIDLAELVGVEHRKSDNFVELGRFASEKRAKEKKSREDQNASTKSFWAKGTGYGTNSDNSSTWNHVEYMKQQDLLSNQINNIFSGLNLFLSTISPEALPQGLFPILEASCLVPALECYLKNDSLLDMGRHLFLYQSVLQMLRLLVSDDTLIPLIDTLPGQATSLHELLSNLNSMAETILRRLDKVSAVAKGVAKTSTELKPATPSPITKTQAVDLDDLPENTKVEKDTKEKDELSVEEQTHLATEITSTFNLVKKQIDRYKRLQRLHNKEEENDVNTTSELSLEQRYRSALKQLQFGEISMLDTNQKDYVSHYKSRISTEALTASAAKIKRLIQEVGTLSNGMPLYLESSVFLRVDEDRIDVMRAMITGPEGTPYDSGCFHFDIYCPPDYPHNPPLVNLQTTGGGSVRFNPNLYNCGKVCLSLLGTWSGGTNERWNEKTSTLLQVLVSIQSLILVEQPYFNEPGYEEEMSTPYGKQASAEYNEVIRLGTIRWAMTEQLRNPSPGFEEVIKAHFKIKRSIIVRQIRKWLKEAVTSKTAGFFIKLKKAVDDLKVELQKLDPEPLDAQLERTESEDLTDRKSKEGAEGEGDVAKEVRISPTKKQAAIKPKKSHKHKAKKVFLDESGDESNSASEMEEEEE
eukprot:TRINITY_DN1498_c0_g2_i1.p1 TRINITY_DN1498_c0_g2~~TRINITY_DN1498_c0_g2_i1.p1  ORF type:complete len:1661 (-),score=558.77 TRINITY_DN1498_c0_g2_i1:26-5008(-)